MMGVFHLNKKKPLFKINKQEHNNSSTQLVSSLLIFSHCISAPYFNDGGGNPHIGLPQSLAQWTDLLVESSLLPKPGLHGGGAKKRWGGLKKGWGGMKKGGAKKGSFLNSPFVQQFISNQQVQAKVSEKIVQNMKENHSFAYNALEREPQRKWEKIKVHLFFFLT